MSRDLPLLLSAADAEQLLGLSNAAVRLSQWHRQGKLIPAGTYVPPSGRTVLLFASQDLLALIQSERSVAA